MVYIILFYFILFLLKDIECGYSLDRLAEAILTVSTIYVLSRNKKKNVYPCKPQFYYIEVGFKWVNII